MIHLSCFVTQTHPHRNDAFSLRSKDSYICLYEHLSTLGLVVVVVFPHLNSNKTQINFLSIYAIFLHVWVRHMVLLSENKFGVCASHQSTVEKDINYFRETFFNCTTEAVQMQAESIHIHISVCLARGFPNLGNADLYGKWNILLSGHLQPTATR